MKLFIIRRIKGLYLLLRLDCIFSSKIFLFLAYLSSFSKWVSKNKNAKYINDFYNAQFNYSKRESSFLEIIKNEIKEESITYLEFGVAAGDSMKWWLKNISNAQSRFYGFDTFEGLPEEFGVVAKGHFNQNGKIPIVNDERCFFTKGLFQETVPYAIPNIDFTKKVILHLDADLYSSTLYLLTKLHAHLKVGDIIIFDEFGVPIHEFKAFLDFISAYNMEYELLNAVNNYYHIAIKITKL
jgi:O-methyltransferase